jgi:hypothetical protein
MVEVDKVCRDLHMLVRTLTNAKFYKLLIESDSLSQDNDDQTPSSSHEASLLRYRVLLN